MFRQVCTAVGAGVIVGAIGFIIGTRLSGYIDDKIKEYEEIHHKHETSTGTTVTNQTGKSTVSSSKTVPETESARQGAVPTAQQSPSNSDGGGRS